ncbi:hypothetical protein BGZ46_001134 [Entomortierella lignicola]|nr:hypothetical protein BGZ46_001134 [Entomortierella lignicola]
MRIEAEFFKTDTRYYNSIVNWLKAKAEAKTSGIIGGLPLIKSRSSQEDNYQYSPRLLFHDLPVPSSRPTILTTPSDRVLDLAHKRVIPLLPMFGPSGCGKTRAAIELLCKQWGFYFNASQTDYGSMDLSSLIQATKDFEQYRSNDIKSNNSVHTLTLILILVRVMILSHCIEISRNLNIHFTCKDWMMAQVAPQSMMSDDLFDILFKKLMDRVHSSQATMVNVQMLVRGRFGELKEMLCSHKLYKRSHLIESKYKILIIVDEAQILGDKEHGFYITESKSPEAMDDPERPLLSPMVHGLYKVSENDNDFCVIPCGTGLSIYDMRYLSDSASWLKDHPEKPMPFTEFGGWGTLTNDTKAKFVLRVPEEAMRELYQRLRGRFRPIISALELMLADQGTNDKEIWESAIARTRDKLESAAPEHNKNGNICHQIRKMLGRVTMYPERYKGFEDIDLTLRMFVCEQYLHGNPLLLDNLQAPLVEASVGRILNFGSQLKTVLDEPFALEAALNYYDDRDPGFMNTVRATWNILPSPSVHGLHWELAMMNTLIHIFHNKMLSETPLFSTSNPCQDPTLETRASIVAATCNRRGINHDRVSLEKFLESHIKHGSMFDGHELPPFYLPAIKPSGPDLVFVLKFEGEIYYPVFVQLKLRHSLSSAQAVHALETVQELAVEGHLNSHRKKKSSKIYSLSEFCTNGKYIGVVICYPKDLSSFEEDLIEIVDGTNIANNVQQIFLTIDERNICNLFPDDHMRALDELKGIKRQRVKGMTGRANKQLKIS